MKMKLLTLCVAMALSCLLRAQPMEITFLSLHQVSLSQLWNVQITTYGSKNTNAWLNLEVKQGGRMIYSARTSELVVKPGANMISSFNVQVTEQQFGSDALDLFITSSGKLPSGQYSGCITAYVGTQQSGSACKELNIQLISPPTLIYPYNGQELAEKTPMLSWLPPVPSSFQGMSYNLKLVEVLEGQSAAEATMTNAPLVWSENLENTSLLYPADAQALEMQKTYAWQVEAHVDDLPMGKSQVWTFRLSEKQLRIEERIASQSYYDLNRQSNAGELNIVKVLRLKYEEQQARGVLELKLLNSSAETISLKKETLKTKSGENYFEIDLSQLRGMKHEEHYAMSIALQNGQRVIVNFMYLDPDKL